MNTVAIIPARMGSSRFPGKPLALIHNIPMIQHVYSRTSSSGLVSKTFVATPDKEIQSFCSSIGAPCIITSNEHERASDRCAEALRQIQIHHSPDIVIMVQGDEPLVSPAMIQESLSVFGNRSSVLVSNLLGSFSSQADFLSPNSIKVAVDNDSNALFFTRLPIPSSGQFLGPHIGKQVCLIPFVADFLHKYVSLQPSYFEKEESIDMMRVLEHGYKVRMIPTSCQSHPVDVLDDIIAVESLMANSWTPFSSS
jgi:3-deoxy-manno-octulosonate cytidylyltransferase (CMP-KDO synthetase)